MLQQSLGVVPGINHPLARRMALIAALSHNLTIGCLFGSFSVLMAPVEQRLGISRELSSMGISVITICNAALAPVVGMLAVRYSLRLLFLLGASLSVLGYVLLATTRSYPLFLAAYGLLLGPGMALSGVVLPATLVTRWFNQGRGKVLGLVHVPIVVAIVPLLTAALITRYDVALAYGTFAVLIGVVLVPLAWLVVDHPGDKTQAQARNTASTQSTREGVTGLQILRSPRFWAVAVSSAVIVSGVVVLSTHMMPMTAKWGISTAAGATLVSVCALAAIPGSILWGWLADKIGGGPALTLAAVNCAMLWGVLLTEPSYALALPVIGLLGLHGSASVPLVSMALSQAFGQASFSRAFGLSTLMTLPFTVIGIQAASSIFVRTGSYVTVILVFIAAFLVVAPMPYLARQRA